MIVTEELAMAAEQIQDWRRRGISTCDACTMLGVIHNRSWDVIRQHILNWLETRRHVRARNERRAA